MRRRQVYSSLSSNKIEVLNPRISISRGVQPNWRRLTAHFAGEDIYGGSDQLLSQVVPRKVIVVKKVDTSDLHEVASAIGPMTKLVWLESPTNPRIQITDIRVILSSLLS
ncbi:hypothetical protein KSP40_PGU002158 [Platanthera guangdongensis]|uniref:Uncharacterized protein n=1 Tax=Platanthera guangdongensis TaxID=2320717 RepID=A0ABR2LXM0_9ASPA